MRIEEVRFPSGGVHCAGDLYLPDDINQVGPVPGLVCGESGAKVKEMVAGPAKYLVQAGLAVLAIDYRSFGASDGEPRGQLFPEQQVDDFRSGISYLQSRSEVDTDRIGLWGNSIAGSVVIQTAIFDQRVKCVVAQSPSMLNGWRATMKIAGRPAFYKLRESLQQEWQHRLDTHGGTTIPWIHFEDDQTTQSYVDLAETYPTFRNEILLESHEHILAWAPENFIEYLAPTPLLIVTNGGWDPYHALDEVEIAFAKAGEPKRLEILPFDAMGLYAEPGLGQAMSLATGWFDCHLRQTPLANRSQLAQDTELQHHA